MHVSTYLDLARRWWFTLLVATWVAGVAGYLVASQVPPTFEARSQLLVGPVNTDFNTLRASGQVAQTYAALATSTATLDQAIERVGAPLTSVELSEATRATASEVTRILSIRVQHGDPNLAAAMANGVGDVLVAAANEGTIRPEGQLTLVEAAVPPTSPIAPAVSLIAMLAAVAGLLVALILASLVEHLSATIRGPGELEDAEDGVPLLGAVPRSPRAGRRDRGRGRGIVVEDQPDSPAARALHVAASKIDLVHPGGDHRSLLVTAAAAEEDTGTLAANLAAAAAEGPGRVVVIDAGGGLEVLGDPGPEAAFRVVTPPEAGFGRDDAAAARAMIERELASASLVIVAGPPVLGNPSALPWARATDAAVVVVHRDQTGRADLRQALDSLRFVGATVIGTVFLHERVARFAAPAPAPTPTPTSTPPPTPAGTREPRGSVRRNLLGELTSAAAGEERADGRREAAQSRAAERRQRASRGSGSRDSISRDPISRDSIRTRADAPRSIAEIRDEPV